MAIKVTKDEWEARLENLLVLRGALYLFLNQYEREDGDDAEHARGLLQYLDQRIADAQQETT